MDSFLSFLKSDFEKKKEKNPRYSMRAYAALLREEPSYLSKIFSGKRQITAKRIFQYSEVLKLEKDAIAGYVQLSTQQERKSSRQSSSERFKHLGETGLDGLPSWLHFVLPELMKMVDFEPYIDKIAERLSISANETEKLIDDLKQKNIISGSEGGYTQNGSFSFKVSKKSEATSKEVLRGILKKSMSLAADSIENEEDWSLMSHGAGFVAAHKENLPEAIRKVGEFRRQLIRFLETSDDSTKKPSHLMNICTLFHPVYLTAPPIIQKVNIHND